MATLGANYAQTSAVPQALPMSTQIADSVYNSAVGSMTPEAQAKGQLIGLAQGALTSTLAPEGTQPISGAMDNFGAAEDAGAANIPGYVPGSAFDAFYQGGGNYDQASYDQGLQNLGNNAFLQKQSTQDMFLPTGQTEVDPNTPYSKQMTDITASAGQGVQDYTNTFNQKAQAQKDEAQTYYDYNVFRNQNPTIDDTQMKELISNPALLPQGTAPEVASLMSRFQTYNNPNMPLFRPI
jgi:hypothetical protein